MTKVSIQSALDRAEFVLTTEVAATTFVQVWYGGPMVHVFNVRGDIASDGWSELTVWTSYGPEGGKPSKDQIRAGMITRQDEWRAGDSDE